MKIAAAICWYDESLEFLTRCVSSLDGLVDEVVAVDGAWSLFEGATASDEAQGWAIKAAAERIGIGCRIVVPARLWRSQVEKRAAVMAHAGRDADWVFVIDADEYVARADAASSRELLEATDAVTATVTIENLHRGEQMPGYHPQGGLRRRFYLAGTTVTVVHSGYAYEGRHLLRGEPELDLAELVALEHDNHNRGPTRNALDRGYREARQRERVEVWT